MKITKKHVQKLITVIDAGLCSGVGEPIPGRMCVEAAVCYSLGLPFGDDPVCVSRALRAVKISLNDSGWSSNKARAKGMKKLAIAQLGSRDAIDDAVFTKRLVELTIRRVVPRALRHAAKLQGSVHAAKLEAAAVRCEQEGTEADAAAYAARAAAYARAADARDEELTFFADLVLEILVEMNAPGVKWLKEIK